VTKFLLIWALVCVIALFAATSHSDVGTASSPPSLPPSSDAVTEPIAGRAAVTVPGNESHGKDPFVPYGIGPGFPVRPGAAMPTKPFWSYADLKPEEQEVVDRGRDTAQWVATHNAFAQGAAELAQRAGANAAASQLGVESLASTGVVQ
jgi:hypothetical protein